VEILAFLLVKITKFLSAEAANVKLDIKGIFLDVVLLMLLARLIKFGVEANVFVLMAMKGMCLVFAWLLL